MSAGILKSILVNFERLLYAYLYTYLFFSIASALCFYLKIYWYQITISEEYNMCSC